MTPTEIAWLAGIIDGEGCIGIGYNRQRNQYQAYINVANTFEPLVYRVEELTGAGHAHPKKAKTWNSRWKPSFVWVCQSQPEVRRILELIEPYSLVKHEQIRVTLEFLNKMSLGVDAKAQIHVLNRKGVEVV